MLKKAGIVVATAAAGLLAMSPLAFAGDDHGRGHDKVKIKDNNVNKFEGDDNRGILSGNNITVQACDVVDVNAAVSGVLALLPIGNDATAVEYEECKPDADSDVTKQKNEVDD